MRDQLNIEAPTIRLAEIFTALSHALDLTEGQPRGHLVRCCWIGTRVGLELGIDADGLSELYYVLLLKDLGCSSNAARICSHYLTDDLTFKHDFKQVDGSLPQALRFILTHTGMQAGMAKRFRALYQALKTGGEVARELIETRCHRGADIALQLRFSDRVAEAILNLDEHWDGSGLPNRLKGSAIPVFSQIALLAQVVDVFNRAESRAAAIREVQLRSDSWFSPDIVAAFVSTAARDKFWQAQDDPQLREALYELEPAKCIRYADEDYLDDIAEAFAQVVDSKSPFTAGHSERVTAFADLIAERLGFSQHKRRWLRRASLLHDMGKLGISNSILDKPGKLDDDEFAAIKLHPVYSEEILANIAAFADIAPIAGGHHERLDGKGYPRGLTADEIGLDTRIVTVADIFDALTADRPYRPAMPLAKALGIMNDMVGEAIDPICFDALQDAIADFHATAA